MKSTRFDFWLAAFAVLGLSCYQLFLCYVHTHIMQVNNGLVAATEGIILIVVTLKVLANQPASKLAMPIFVGAYFLMMFALRGEVDPQGVRNVFIIYIMFCLGRQMSSMQDVNRIIWLLSFVVAVFCFFEYFLIDQYLNVFNIKQYYVARGLVTEEQLSYLSTNLYTSGLRPGGRTMLPGILSDQRVSSVFLEPVSMGNFAAIICMWALSFDVKEWKKSVPHFMAGVFFIVAGDSRFASMIIMMLIVVRCVPLLQKPMALYLLPPLILAGHAYFATLGFDSRYDDLTGRLAKSGEALLQIELWPIFGVGSVEELYDMGMLYSMVVFGIGLCVFLWARLVFLRFPTAQGMRMRAMLAVYCMGLLLISGSSFYSSKTAGLLWFILGALYPVREAVTAVVAQTDASPPPEQTATAL